MEMSFLPIIVAIVLNMAIAMVWYSPWLFGKSWVTALGFDIKQMKASPLCYVGATIVCMVTVGVTAVLIHKFNITTLMEAIELGLYLWLGFIATNHFSGVLWAKKSLKVFYIDTGYLLVITLLNTILLTLWK